MAFGIDLVYTLGWMVLPVLALGTAAILLQALYNRYFHTLSTIPGPFWGSITQFYLVRVIASVPMLGLELHKKHGPVIRLSPNVLSVSDPELLPQIYHRYADKGPCYGSWMFGESAATFQTIGWKDHAIRRKAIAACCSMNAMKLHHESKIDERVQEFCDKISERSCKTGRSLDFAEHIRYFLSDTFSHIVYGAPLGLVRRGEDFTGLLDAIQGVYPLSGTAAVMPWLMPLLRHPLLKAWLWRWTQTFKDIEKLCLHVCDGINLRQRRGELKNETCFFDLATPSLSPKTDELRGPNTLSNIKTFNVGTNTSDLGSLSKPDLVAEIVIFTAASLDGVAAFISPFMNNMLQRPEIHHRVMAEIDAADQRGGLSLPVAKYEETTKLKYFMACVKETLRYNSPAVTLLPRIVSNPGYDLRIDNNGKTMYIPPGVQIGASPYIIHRNASVFGPHPECFNPARWIPGEFLASDFTVTEESIKRMERFGMWWGFDRECAGKNYAYMQIQKLCVEMLRRFKWHTGKKEGLLDDSGKGFRYEQWAVGMFWDQWIAFEDRGLQVPS